MNKLIKYALYGIIGLIVLVLMVVGYFAATFNPNDYREEIIKLVKDKKERNLHINGDIKLTYWPKIGADLGKLPRTRKTLLNPPATTSEIKINSAEQLSKPSP